MRLTNKEFAAKDKLFRACCAVAETDPTKRQAAKYRRQSGKAYESRNAVLKRMAEDREFALSIST